MSDSKRLRVVVVGLGQMGVSHARAYHQHPACTIVGMVVRRSTSTVPEDLAGYPRFTDFESSLATHPDIVCIATHTDTHVPYAIAAMEAGAHVFVEKPLAHTVAEAQRVLDMAQRLQRKLVVGHILRHHPTWAEFVRQARALGPPYVMRMNLNQQSRDEQWTIHKRILELTSPVVDCGVHYIDVMLQVTDSKPKQVRGMGVRLSDDIDKDQVNYGHLQVIFEDGSVGFYEAGWGPMISETAHFIKDIFGPKGAVSIVRDESKHSADVSSHATASTIRRHDASTGKTSDWIATEDPDHDASCALEQAHLVDAIQNDRDITRAQVDAVRSLAVVLAADLSMREGRAVEMSEFVAL